MAVYAFRVCFGMLKAPPSRSCLVDTLTACADKCYVFSFALLFAVGILNHPWFQVGLPKEATAMNANFLRMPRACSQSEEDIWRVIKKAREQVQVEMQECSMGGMPAFPAAGSPRKAAAVTPGVSCSARSVAAVKV